MDEEIQQPEPKISDVEIVLVGLFYVALDAIDLIPIAGEITDMIAAPMGFYYWSKGLSGTAFLAAEVLDLIPIVQAIPSRTISWGATVYIDRHPKLEAALGSATKIAGALEGDVEGAESAASEAQEAAAKRSATISEGGTASIDARVPAAGGVAATQEEDGSGATGAGETKSDNAKPSEKSTERGNVQDVQTGEDNQSPENANQPTEEERRKQATDARYGEITTPEAEKNPIDVAKQEELGDEVQARKSETPNNELAAEDPRESESTRYLRERFAREQAKQQKAREGRDEFEKPKRPQNVTPINERQTQNEDRNALDKAA
jgi:hypothetical protein